MRLSALFKVALIFVTLVLSQWSLAADDGAKVQLDAKKAGPRAVENLTQNIIVRDYRTAWNSLARALDVNSLEPLDGPFTGEAKQWLWQSVMSQQKSGLSRRYLDQNHKVEAVFYAPEGDVLELRDTADYRLQILDQGKVVNEEHVTAHYVVLMTPSADHWMVRNLQSVQRF